MFGYDLNGNRQSINRANGVSTSYSYDAQNRLKQIAHAKGQTLLSHFDYSVRDDGKRTGVQEQLANFGTAATSRTVGYLYDGAGRLTKEAGQDWQSVSYENSWQYDAASNRAGTLSKRATLAAPNTLASVTTSVAQFNQNDWLTNQTSTTQTTGQADTTSQTAWNFDGNGAEVAQQAGTSTPLQNGWNFDGTLATTGTSAASTAFSYDASGNRLKVAKAGKEQRYLVDPNTSYAQVVQERDETGVLQARYLWEDGLAPLVQFRRTSTGDYAAFFYLCDGQDSVRQLTDASGNVTDSYYYDAFGNALQGGTGTTPNPFRYTGQQLDDNGRYFLRARYYSTGTGRFLSHDPLMGSSGDPVSLHRYLYGANDGVNFADPSGNEFTLAGALTSIGVRATVAAPMATAIGSAFTYAGWVGSAGAAYNIISDYQAGADISYWDVADVLLQLMPFAGKSVKFFRQTNLLKGIGAGGGSYRFLGEVIEDAEKLRKGIATMGEALAAKGNVRIIHREVSDEMKALVGLSKTGETVVQNDGKGVYSFIIRTFPHAIKDSAEFDMTVAEEMIHVHQLQGWVDSGRFTMEQIHNWCKSGHWPLSVEKELEEGAIPLLKAIGVEKRISW